MRRQGQRGIDRMKIFASSSASAKMLEQILDHRTRTGLRCEQTKPASTGGWGKLNFHLAALETSSSQRYWHKLYTVGQRGLNRAMDVLITCYGFTISSGLAVLRSKQSQISICSQLSSRVGTFYQNLASENGKKKITRPNLHVAKKSRYMLSQLMDLFASLLETKTDQRVQVRLQNYQTKAHRFPKCLLTLE